MMQLDLFTRPSPPRRPTPSDTEIWEAVLHPDGYRRLATLMESRHGSDHAAASADLSAFTPPDEYVTRCQEERKWAGSIVNLIHRYSEGRAA